MKHLLSILLLALAVPLATAGPAEAVAVCLADARKLPPEIRRQTRYLDAQGLPKDAGKVLDFHANQLSKNSELIPLRRVSDDLFAAVLGDYSWDAKVWEKFSEIDPYYHVRLAVVVRTVTVRKLWPGGKDAKGIEFPKGTPYDVTEKLTKTQAASAPWLPTAAIAELILLTGSQAPIVRADWWFAQTARQLSLGNKQTGVGYYDFLGVKNRADFQKLARFKEQDSLDIGKEIRAAVDRSGVAQQNRQVVRLQALTGAYWVTLDTDDSTGKGNAVRNLARGDYAHKAEEVYLQAANGLFYYFLGDAAGVRQDSAPDFIGPDDSPLRAGRDSRIHVCLACVRCHTDGLRSVDDWARRTLKAPTGIQAADYQKYLELRRAYFSNLDKQLDRDRQQYVDALKEINGLTPAENAKAFSRLWDWYVRDRGPADIAADMGKTEEQFLTGLKAYTLTKRGEVDLVLLGLLKAPPQPIRVEYVEELWPELWKAFGYK